jgi:hypothetical protein
VRAKLRVRHLLREGGGACHHHGALSLNERVERRDAQPHEVGRRRQVRLVLHAARRVEAHRARGEEGLEVGGEVARRAVVTRHHERGTGGIRVHERCQQVRAQARGHKRPLRLLARRLRERHDGVAFVGVCEELA